jgi:hypothetical protein
MLHLSLWFSNRTEAGNQIDMHLSEDRDFGPFCPDTPLPQRILEKSCTLDVLATFMVSSISGKVNIAAKFAGFQSVSAFVFLCYRLRHGYRHAKGLSPDL